MRYCIAILVLFIIIVNCTDSPVSGVETTNGATVTAGYDTVEGKTLPGVHVHLFVHDYDPFQYRGLYSYVQSDSSGFFRFAEINAGKYNIIIRNEEAGHALIVQQLMVGEPKPVHRAEHFSNTGTLSGTVIHSRSTQVLIVLPGTDYYQITDSDNFTIEDLPKGEYTVNFRTTEYGLGDPTDSEDFGELEEQAVVTIQSSYTTYLETIRLD